MKIIYVIIIAFILVSCGSSIKSNENFHKVKTYKNEKLIVNYPNNWLKFGALGYIYFIPKEVNASTFENEVEHVSVNKNRILIGHIEQIENALKNHAETLSRNKITGKFEIIKLNSDSKFIYKIESSITYNFSQYIYKRVEYFYMNENNLEYFTYQMREELFNFYLEDALLIINSVQHI